ncbi:hypothetical protein BH23PLA1_BH23PLA1_29200 [soil metagenome]
MAIEAAMKPAVRRVAQVFKKYAVSEGWRQGDYRILVDVNPDWGRIHVIFVARDFPGRDIEDSWISMLDFIDRELKVEPDLAEAINLSLRTFDEVDQGGIYELPPSYVDADELSIGESTS